MPEISDETSDIFCQAPEANQVLRPYVHAAIFDGQRIGVFDTDLLAGPTAGSRYVLQVKVREYRAEPVDHGIQKAVDEILAAALELGDCEQMFEYDARARAYYVS